MEQNVLRSGYTTGTCAAAAAKAAAAFLLTGRCPETAEVALPGGRTVRLETAEVALPGGRTVQLETEEVEKIAALASIVMTGMNETLGSLAEPRSPEASGSHAEPGSPEASGSHRGSGNLVVPERHTPQYRAARVQKDAGDDPDVTHGAWIYAAVSEISPEQLEAFKSSGSGYWLSDNPNLYLSGGTGIGMVTKPGLSCPVGHYAINPVPRQMILMAVQEAVRKAAFEGCLFVQIAIPDGVRLAEKTFNPKLGIVGGISVLGTTGIVKPMSEAALVATIRLDIHMRVVDGQRILLMAPGNYGESFLQENMGVSLGEAVLCSNFVRDAAVMLAEEGVRRVLFVSHIGKLVKVSAGIPNTHSRYGDGRMEQMEQLTAEAWMRVKRLRLTGLPEQNALSEQNGLPELLDSVGSCNTTDEAVGVLLKHQLAEPVLSLAAEKAKTWMESWADGNVEVEVVTFSSAHGILGKTGGADALFESWKERL